MMIAVTPKIPKAVATTVSSSNSYTNNALFGLSFPFSEYDPVAREFTCIGQTKKHQRCHNDYISKLDKECAANRLRLMRSSNPGNSFELDALTELASWMLCPRWHKSQCDEIARQWHRDLVSASAPLRSSQYGQQTPPSAYFSRTPSSADSFLSSGTGIFSSAGRSSISSISPFNSPLTPSSDAEFLKATSQNETNRPMGREGFPKDPARNLAPVFSAMSNKWPIVNEKKIVEIRKFLFAFDQSYLSWTTPRLSFYCFIFSANTPLLCVLNTYHEWWTTPSFPFVCFPLYLSFMPSFHAIFLYPYCAPTGTRPELLPKVTIHRFTFSIMQYFRFINKIGYHLWVVVAHLWGLPPPPQLFPTKQVQLDIVFVA
jgi:hypothetical protein